MIDAHKKLATATDRLNAFTENLAHIADWKEELQDRLQSADERFWGDGIDPAEQDALAAEVDAFRSACFSLAAGLSDKKRGGVNNQTDADAEAWRGHIVTAAYLKTAKFPPVSFVVPNLLPEGLCLLAGKPKVGKSWLGLELCLGVAGDHEVLGGLRPLPGDVLYCALEDTPQRLQRRIRKINRGVWPERLTFATSWRKLDAGGVEDIRNWASAALCPRLVILDTLAHVRPERSKADTTYEGDYKAMLELQKLANELGMLVLMLHHTRKMDADDPFDTISGTLGLSGCADTLSVLARGPQGTTLHVRGRDVEECAKAITFHSDTCRWAIMGDAADVNRSDTRKKIMAAVGSNEDMTPDQIAGASGVKAGTVRQRLPSMLTDGEIVKLERGKYRKV